MKSIDVPGLVVEVPCQPRPGKPRLIYNPRPGVHRFKVGYVGKYTINFNCRKCPMIVVVDKFAFRAGILKPADRPSCSH